MVVESQVHCIIDKSFDGGFAESFTGEAVEDEISLEKEGHKRIRTD
jgi:hypothetical protein